MPGLISAGAFPATPKQPSASSTFEHGSITIRMEYADFADYWEPLLGGQGPVGAYVENLLPDRHRLIEDRVRGAFLSGAPDGPRSLTATGWAVRGIVSGWG